VEALFYALFPLVLWSMPRIKGRTLALLCGVYAACLCVPPGVRTIAPQGHAAATMAAFLVSSRLPILHLPLFLIGVYLGMGYRAKAGVSAQAERSPGVWFRCLPYLAAAGSLALLCAGPSGVYEPARRGLLALCYAGLIYGLAQVRGGLLTSRWMVLAGEISFSIYILQMPVFRTVLGVARRLHTGPYASIWAALTVLIAVSYFAYRFIELPARVAIRRRLTHRPVRLESI
jgi:peptidoglycan/LPS O-acetylase OafA/YrhL